VADGFDCYVGAVSAVLTVSRPGVVDVNGLRALRRARDRIDRDYAEQLDIAALAADAGYSLGQFIRAFDAAYGETPGRYRTRRRVERACELLRSVNLTVTEICMLVGFSSLGSFSRRFADIVGRSPSEYRREAARVGGPAPIPGCFALMWRTGLPAPDAAAPDATAPDAVEPAGSR
jgi:AraC-like DNA-binding protein